MTFASMAVALLGLLVAVAIVDCTEAAVAVGVRMRTLTMTLPGGREETLIRIPEWDYNWQEMYALKEPIKLPKGTVLRVRATFDNSEGNPLNPHTPPIPVRLGEQTENEMCFVFCGVSSPDFGVRKFKLNFSRPTAGR